MLKVSIISIKWLWSAKRLHERLLLECKFLHLLLACNDLLNSNKKQKKILNVWSEYWTYDELNTINNLAIPGTNVIQLWIVLQQSQLGHRRGHKVSWHHIETLDLCCTDVEHLVSWFSGSMEEKRVKTQLKNQNINLKLVEKSCKNFPLTFLKMACRQWK